MSDAQTLAAVIRRLPAPHGRVPTAWPDRGLSTLSALESEGLMERLCAEGRPLREHLRALAVGPIAAGLLEAPGRSVLLSELMFNLHEPGRINQGFKGTCAATCVETWLVETNPAEYARLIAGLAAPEGQVPLRGGGLLVRDEERLDPSAEEGRRSPVSRLFQVACMEFAYDKRDYDNKTDRQSGEKGSGVGLHLDAFDRLLEAVSGERWDVMSDLHLRMAKMLGLSVDDLPDLQRDGLPIIERSIEGGESTFVTLKVSEGRLSDGAGHVRRLRDQLHKVRVLEVDRAGGRVIFEDPLDPTAPWYQGVDACVLDTQGRASLPLEAFLEMMVELSYRPEFFVRG
ncbi:MAG: hypothetical protein H6741_22790 [Alphaproteobacteria bacterium]|nr:hypothetical protein [Alphaproteobacteria bacterium]